MTSARRIPSVNTLLLRAARTGDGAAVRQALAAGANPSFQDARGRTAVWYACAARSDAALVALIETGATPTRDPVALDALLENGHVTVFLRLMAAEPHKFSPHLTLLRTAAMKGLTSVVEAWPPHSPKDVRVLWQMVMATDRLLTQPGTDALWTRFPVETQHPLYAKILDHGIRRGVLPQGLLARMRTAEAVAPLATGSVLPRVQEAAALGHTALALRLIGRLRADPSGWSVPATNFFEEICFSAAAHASRSLLQAAAALKGWDEKDLASLKTPKGTLLHAVFAGNGDVPRRAALVRLLLRHGADVNARNAAGRTPLHEAAITARTARPGSPTLLTILDEAGASWSACDRENKKPLDLLRHNALVAQWTAVLATREFETALPPGQAVRVRHRF